MIIMPFNISTKSLFFIGRGADHSLLRFTDEQSGEDIYITMGAVTVRSNDFQYDDTFSDLKDKHTYSLTIYSSNALALLTSGEPTNPLTWDADAHSFVTYRDRVMVGIDEDAVNGLNYEDVVEHKTTNTYIILD